MYISTADTKLLDSIIKDFEVAFRSYIADCIVQDLPNANSFKQQLDIINRTIEPSSIVNSDSIKEKLRKIIANYKSKYIILENVHDSYKRKDYLSNDVPYVSELIDYLFIFFNKYYSNCCKPFASVEEFLSYSKKYHNTRNTLSHPASSKTLSEDAKDVAAYVRKLITLLDHKYFWYVPKNDIEKNIELFLLNIEYDSIPINNLHEIGISHKKIVCRERELEDLKNLIVPEDISVRTADSVLIYGYGGVGKTALAIEFIYELIKGLLDKRISSNFDFIFFFSSKDEALRIFETTGKIYVDAVKKHFSTFDELQDNIFKYLKITSSKELAGKSGIIVIDNIENLNEGESRKIFEFILQCPRSVKFILTSRNEEGNCERKIHIREFDQSSGKLFIAEYLGKNGIDVQISDDNKLSLLAAAKGNTLILILSLQSLSDGRQTCDEIVEQLQNIESSNIEVIAEFMYKNTFDSTIEYINTKWQNPIDLVKIISLYNEPIDLASISSLCGLNISECEEICDLLTRKLILNKIKGLYCLNEFANKFILIKYLPNRIETNVIRSKISRHKQQVQKDLARLEKLTSRSIELKHIMEDWKPATYTDKIAISRTFSAYSEAIKILTDAAATNKILDEITKSMKMTSHPYILVQYIRVKELLLEKNHEYKNADKRKNTIEELRLMYEEAVERILFRYIFIVTTRSYAIFLKNYGRFLRMHANDTMQSARYVEEAKERYSAFEKDRAYFSIVRALATSYANLYKQTFNKSYLHLFLSCYNEIEKGSFGNLKNRKSFFERFHSFKEEARRLLQSA